MIRGTCSRDARPGILLIGPRVLAAADVIAGRRVTGRPEYFAEYETAGATYVPYPVPPVRDGNIVTSRDGPYYGSRVCGVARTVLDSMRAAGSPYFSEKGLTNV